MSFLRDAALCFGSLFSIVDPFAAVPMFLALVGGQSKVEQRQSALRGVLTCLIVLGAFALAGPVIFRFFNLTLPAFKLAGGVLLFLVGLEMIRAKPSSTRSTPEERVEAEGKADVGIIPLGVPLLAGPGSIATVMVLTAKTPGGQWPVLAALSVVCLLTFLILRSAGLFARVLGRTGINVITRMMGLILAATAVQFFIDGVREAFPVLSPPAHVATGGEGARPSLLAARLRGAVELDVDLTARR